MNISKFNVKSDPFKVCLQTILLLTSPLMKFRIKLVSIPEKRPTQCLINKSLKLWQMEIITMMSSVNLLFAKLKRDYYLYSQSLESTLCAFYREYTNTFKGMGEIWNGWTISYVFTSAVCTKRDLLKNIHVNLKYTCCHKKHERQTA